MATPSAWEDDGPVEELAHRQLGRFTRAQVAELCDRPADRVRSRLRSGRWRRQSSRVLALPGAPGGWRSELWTAWLHVGSDSVVSHHSAARIYDLPVLADAGVTLTVQRGSHRRYAGATVHQRGDLLPVDVALIDGLPVTRPARTLYDCANEVSKSRLETWLDDLTANRRTTPLRVAATVERLSGPGKHGVPELVDLLAERLPADGVTEGPLEAALAQLVVLAGLPPGIAQLPHPGSIVHDEFVDRGWPEARLVVETDGRCWHDRLRAARKDARRDLEAAAAGWQTIRLRYDMLTTDPGSTARLVRDTYECRLAEVSGAVLGDSTTQVESLGGVRGAERLDLSA